MSDPKEQGVDAAFEPGSTPKDFVSVEGPSFPWTVKAIASVMVGGLLLLAWKSLDLAAWKALDLGGKLFLMAATGVVLSGYWGILTSRTRFDGERIVQSWLWRKEVRVSEITQLKLIYVPGLTWILVPRLIVRSGGLTLTTFHLADAQVLASCRRLAYG